MLGAASTSHTAHRQQRTFHNGCKWVGCAEERFENFVSILRVGVVAAKIACAATLIKNLDGIAVMPGKTAVCCRYPLSCPELLPSGPLRQIYQTKPAGRLQSARLTSCQLQRARPAGGDRTRGENARLLSTSKASETSSKLACASGSSHRSGCHLIARLRYL